jgi:hypothetical protein
MWFIYDTLLVFMDIKIQSWYVYKQHITRRIHTIVLLQTIFAATTKNTHSQQSLKRRTPAVGPHFGSEETPTHETLASHNIHQPHKTGSSPIRNIMRKSPPSLFNARSRANAIAPFKRTDHPASYANTKQ